ncbi:hypothetical protein, partial [Lacticaseibacillus pantheris]|uniref:hypothetical protein n=1 Tax=Lacticaseibacillus pantheris TaxID=171523 RepID=UPI001CDA6B9B
TSTTTPVRPTVDVYRSGFGVSVPDGIYIGWVPTTPDHLTMIVSFGPTFHVYTDNLTLGVAKIPTVNAE